MAEVPPGNIPPFISAIRSIFQGMSEFSEDTKSAFGSLKEAAASSGLEPQQLRSIKKAVIPAVFKSVSESIAADPDTTEGPLSSEAIESVVSAVAPKLEESPATEEIKNAVNSVLRSGLGDAAVVNVLRKAALAQIAAKLEHMDEIMMHHHEMRHGFEEGHGMPPFMMAMRKFFHSGPEYSEDVKSSIRSLKETVSSAGLEPKQLREIKKSVFPTVFKSVTEAIESDPDTTEGPLSSEAIESITANVKSKLDESPATEEISSGIITLLTNGLNDPAVVNVARSLPLRAIITKMEAMDGHDVHAASLETEE